MFRSWGAVLVILAGLGPVSAQGIDPADVTFWQTIQNSQDPAEYQAYLQAFPEGTFAELARLRIQNLGGTAAPGPGSADTDQTPGGTQETVAGPATSDVVGDGTLTVEPAAPRVGDMIKVTSANMPNLTSADSFIVVPAGTPDAETKVFTENVLSWTYATTYANKVWDTGPFPPGAYEVRWITQLYSLKKEDQIGARTSFEVSR